MTPLTPSEQARRGMELLQWQPSDEVWREFVQWAGRVAQRDHRVMAFTLPPLALSRG